MTKKNNILLVFDSLRYDILESANLPFLKSLGTWKKALAQASWTLPAHMSFWMGKLPQALDDTEYYDTTPVRGGGRRNYQLWGLAAPPGSKCKARMFVPGANIIEGFGKVGYKTVGTGAVPWFNPKTPAGKYLTESFKHFKYFEGDSFRSAARQVPWARGQVIDSDKPYFLFINFGETHHPYALPGQPKTNPYGDKNHCRNGQRKAIEYLDQQVEKLLEGLKSYNLVITADHGECMGEDGLWGHSFSHPKVMEIPMLVTERGA